MAQGVADAAVAVARRVQSLVDEYDIACKRIAELEAERDELARSALVALAGCKICTPEEGYVKAGANWLRHDIEALGRERDRAVADKAALPAELNLSRNLIKGFPMNEEYSLPQMKMDIGILAGMLLLFMETGTVRSFTDTDREAVQRIMDRVCS